MPRRDEYGIWHVLMSDTTSAWGSVHLDHCPVCRAMLGGPPFNQDEWDAYVMAFQEQGATKMATKEVLQSTCDRCGAEETTEIDKVIGKRGKNKIILPTAWLHVKAVSAFTSDALNLDLCGKCSSELINWSVPVEAREGE